MQKDNKKRPFISIKDIIIGGIVVLFTAIAFGKPVPFFDASLYAPTRDVSNQEITSFAEHDIIDLPVSKIVAKIEEKDGKPTFMVIYSSWCGYCKILMPHIINLKKEGKLENINLIFISIDKDKMKLAEYLLSHDYDKFFTPYIVEKNVPDALENMITSKGHYYDGVVPYTVIFNDEGKIISAIRGRMNKKHFLEKVVETTANK